MLNARSFALVTAALSLSVPVAVVACSSTDDASNETTSPASTSYRGLLTGPRESGVIDVVIGAPSATTTSSIRPQNNGGGATVAGSITLLVGGSTITLTGSYDATTGALTLTGSSPKGTYSLKGTSTAGGFSGTYEGPSGAGTFSLASSTNGAATLICGSAQSSVSGKLVSAFNLVVDASGNATGASCGGGGCSPLVGKIDGTTITVKNPTSQQTGATGTIADGKASGTWTSDKDSGTWSGSTAACQPSIPPSDDAGSDAGGAGNDAAADGGDDAGGPTIETLLQGVDEPVSMAIDNGYAYWLSGASAAIERCALPTCNVSTQVATGLSVPSSVAAESGIIYWTNGFRYVMSCAAPANGTCTGTTFTDLGASVYPAHLATTADRIYWISESAQSRLIQTCPLAGCTAGYPKTVFSSESPSPLHGAAISGFTTDGNNAYVALFTGGIYRITLTTPETADAASVALVQASAYGTSELDLDGTTLRWGLSNDGKVAQCTAPLCATVSDLATGRASPVGTRSTATDIYGFDRGTAKQGGGYDKQSGSVWHIHK